MRTFASIQARLFVLACIAGASLVAGCMGDSGGGSETLVDTTAADAAVDDAGIDTADPDTQGSEPDAGSQQDVADCDPAACDDQNPCNGVELCVVGGCAPAAEVPPAGTACGAGLICTAGLCVLSRCGDGYLDVAAGEGCDDGNVAPSDGCEPNCQRTCTQDAHCQDDEPCNGTESCDVQTGCYVGTPLADGTSCGDGLICRSGACVDAACGDGVTTGSEACDDGNDVDGDGCDLDCTLSCTEDGQCDDLDPCNGVETCDTTSHACVPGTPLECVDDDPCTEDACAPEAGCTFPLIDEDGDGRAPASLGTCGTDCDDGDATIYDGAEELCDGKDNDCDDGVDESAPYWYADCDGDGLALDTSGAVQQCAAPSSVPALCGGGGTWTTTRPSGPASTDCNDENADVFPGQAAYFTTAIAGTTSFDYDCDGVDTPKTTWIFDHDTCQTYKNGCVNVSGWTTAVPLCGADADFIPCLGFLSCMEGTQRVSTQACR